MSAAPPDITFHSLRATHATMFVLEGGTMREMMDDLGHTSLTIAVDSYQRVVKEHHRDTVELLTYQYMPSDDPAVIRAVIDQKERQIGKLQDEVDRLRRILCRNKIPEHRNTERTEKRDRHGPRNQWNRPAYPTRLSVAASIAATLKHNGACTIG